MKIPSLRLIPLLLSLLAPIACSSEPELWSDIDLSEFEDTSFDPMDPLLWNPAIPATYIEVRQGAEYLGDEDSQILGTAGQKCSAADDFISCAESFAALEASTGFEEYLGMRPAQGVALPGYKYAAVNRGNENFVVASKSELLAFLVPIDTAGEASLLTRLAGYSVGSIAYENGGSREVEGGYEVVAVRTERTCEPFLQKRFLIKISSEGAVEELRSQVFRENDDACVMY